MRVAMEEALRLRADGDDTPVERLAYVRAHDYWFATVREERAMERIERPQWLR